VSFESGNGKVFCAIFKATFTCLKNHALLLKFPDSSLRVCLCLPQNGKSFQFAVKHHRWGLDEFSRYYYIPVQCY